MKHVLALVILFFAFRLSAQDLIYQTSTGNIDGVKKAVGTGCDVNAKGNGNNTALHIAASKGYAEIVKFLLENHADVDAVNSQGFTPLIFSCSQMHPDIVEVLVDHHADVNKKSNEGVNALMVAAAAKPGPHHQENSRMVKTLLDKGAKVNEASRVGASPLMMAIEDTNTEAVKLLLDKGSDVNRQMNDGTTALHLAANVGSGEIVKWLLASKNIRVNEKGGPWVATPLLIAAYKNNIDIVKLLLGSKNIQLDEKAQSGVTALLLAVQYDNIEMTRALLEKGASPNLDDLNGLTPLMLAAEKGSIESARLLLAKGADIKAFHPNGYDILDLAALHGRKDAVQFLIDNGAKISQTSAYGDLLAATNGGLPEMAILALATGANFNAQIEVNLILPFFFALHRDTSTIYAGDKQVIITAFSDSMCFLINDKELKMTPLRLAVINRREDIALLLIDRGADFSIKANQTAMYEAVGNRLLQTLRLALQKGFDLKTIMDTAQYKLNAFGLACDLYPIKGDSEIIELMLKYGIDINAKDGSGQTQLKRACVYKRTTSLVEFLLNKGADMEIGDDENTTPLIQAAYNGCDETITLLLAHGANINTAETVTRKNSAKGRTALMAAALRGQVGSVYLLLAKKGVHVNAKDEDGKTALKYALEKNQTAIIDLLKKAGATE